MDKKFLFFSFLNLFIFYFNNLLFCNQKIIKQISSDITEINREKKEIKFSKNVKVDLENGYIICDKARYYELENKILCESNIYCLFISTTENFKIEINSNYAKYDFKNKILEFKNNVFTKYQNFSSKENEINHFEVSSDYLSIKQGEKKITFRNNVEILTKEGKILCELAKYYVEDETFLLNDNYEEHYQRINFFYLEDSLKIKSLKSNKAKIKLKENMISLNGNAEVIIIQ